LRLPVRIKGMLGGLAVLAVGPVIALGHGGHPALTGVAPSAPAQVEAIPAAHLAYLPPRDAVAEIRLPDPTPAPTPAPTHAPPTARPVATPVPLPPPSAGTIEAIIYAAATKYGVSYSWMLKIARCESSLNPRAYNPAGPYIGLFQFLPSTFRAHGGTDIYDPVQQANITADMLAHGQAGAWGCA
jgi:hypothetical protein